ncbi:MAG: zf-TFIIB domain-containing protein [Nanoarchaeota archaeon]
MAKKYVKSRQAPPEPKGTIPAPTPAPKDRRPVIMAPPIPKIPPKPTLSSPMPQCQHTILELQPQEDGSSVYRCPACGGILKITMPRLFIST